jgi:GNAT superfamily N-acetyltransferase
MTTDFEVRPVVEDDWQQYRAIRLEMLLDTPSAFAVRLETAQGYTEAEWRERAARGDSTSQVLMAAIAADGSWIGAMGSYVKDLGAPMLFGVYVAPAFRGRDAGVTDALLERVETWRLGGSRPFASRFTRTTPGPARHTPSGGLWRTVTAGPMNWTRPGTRSR